MDAADYVLRDFSPAERAELAVTLEEAADAVQEVLQLGLDKAQLRLHTV
jgi:PTH1 family peptidyl-tRNA hydrolase